MRWFKRNTIKQYLGVNRRNLDYIFAMNPRNRFVWADDKVQAKEILARQNIPVPRNICVADTFADLPACVKEMQGHSALVVKPAKGYGGEGILVLTRAENGWKRGSSTFYSDDDIHFYLASILSGMYARDQVSDRGLVEELVRDEAGLETLHDGTGLSDIRVIVCNAKPVMAMLRLPCSSSKGRANLHSGGIGVGVDIATGVTTHAVQDGVEVHRHIDTNLNLAGFQIPFWRDIIEVSSRINSSFEMDYLGLDFVIDRDRGPLVLEVNVRPGLDIQLANQCGLQATLLNAIAGERS